MAVPNTFSNGTVADADEVNANFTYVGLVPIGSVISWLKSLTNCPALDDRFVECNGQTLSDAGSVFNGVVIPNLNGNANFLYGAATSGGTKSENFVPSHDHDFSFYNSGATTSLTAVGSATNTTNTTWVNTVTSGTAWTGYAVVYIIRVK